MIWIPMAIGAAIGAAKNAGDQQSANKQRKAQSELTRYSPWTGIQGTAVKDPSLFGNVTQGAAAGAMIGSGMGAGGAGTAGAAGEGVAGTGTGATQFSLAGGAAGNSAPFTLGATGAAPSAYGSQFGLEGLKGASVAGGATGSAGALGSLGSMNGMGPWSQLPMSEDMEQYMARLKNPYDLK